MANEGGTTSSPKHRYFALFVLVRMKGVFYLPASLRDRTPFHSAKAMMGRVTVGGTCRERAAAAKPVCSPPRIKTRRLPAEITLRVRVDLSRFAPVSGRVRTIPIILTPRLSIVRWQRMWVVPREQVTLFVPTRTKSVFVCESRRVSSVKAEGGTRSWRCVLSVRPKLY